MIARLLKTLGAVFSTEQVPEVPAPGLWEELTSDAPPAIIDVRTPHEYRSGHIPGAVNVPLHGLSAVHPDLPKGERLVLVCLSGHRSAVAYRMLDHEQLLEVRHLPGGMHAWKRSRLPVE